MTPQQSSLLRPIALLVVLSLFIHLPGVLANGVELDIVFPRDGERYAVTPRGLPVVVAIQNPKAAYEYGWAVWWYFHQDPRQNDPPFGYASGILSGINSSVPDSVNDAPNTISFVLDSTSFTLPAGAYTFEWEVATGPQCWFQRPSSLGGNGSGYVNNPIVSRGTLSLEAATDAPTPTIAAATGRRTCPTPAAVLSFDSLTWFSFPSFTFSWDQTETRVFPTSTGACGVTTEATQPGDPCRVTADAQLELSVYKLMGWSAATMTTAAMVTARPSNSDSTPFATTSVPTSSAGHTKLATYYLLFGLLIYVLGG
jgi:hypothetical protein